MYHRWTGWVWEITGWRSGLQEDYPGDFWILSVNIILFPSQPVTSFGFSSLNWGIFHEFLWSSFPKSLNLNRLFLKVNRFICDESPKVFIFNRLFLKLNRFTCDGNFFCSTKPWPVFPGSTSPFWTKATFHSWMQLQIHKWLACS
jgi:hypothetical protein